MITEERVMSLLARANPEPDEKFDLDSTAASYLATLHERSAEVTELGAPAPYTRARGPWRPTLVVAMLLILIVGLGVLLINQPADESPAATDPTPPTTIVESALTDIPVWLGQASPGTYQPTGFSLPFAFTVAEGGWETGAMSETMFAICGPDVEGPVGARSACFRASAVAMFLLEPTTVEDTQALLAAVQGAEITDVEPVTIDGAQGVRFAFTHDLVPRSNPEGGYDGYPYWLHESQEIPLGADMSIVSIVDVDGTVVTVVYQGRAITEPSAFQTNLAEGMAIVESIVWDR